MANYAWGIRPIPDVNNGHVFEYDNFVQVSPHTVILAGKTGLTFRNCNLTNCDVPAGATVDSCLEGHVSFCSHVHPDLVANGLASCATNCTHLIDTDIITIDGVEVDRINYYADSGVA